MAANGKGFYGSLESTRGIAALAVALFHAAQAPLGAGLRVNEAMLSSEPGTFWRAVGYAHKALANGQGAVVFFFVLSGFVLSGSLARAPNQVGAAAVQFGLARLFRIYPAVISTILLFWLTYLLTGLSLGPVQSYEPWTMLKAVLLLDASIDGVMWSLQSELLAVPLIFLTFLLTKRFGTWCAVLIAAVLAKYSLSSKWNTVLALPGGPSRVAYMYSFVFGMVSFYLGAQFCRMLTAFRLRFMQAGALVLAVCVIFGAHVVMLWTWRLPLVESVAAATIISLLAFGSLPRVKTFLSHPALRFYGRISYSFYVLHPLTLAVIWFIPDQLTALTNAGVPAVLVAWILGIGSVLAVTPLAALSYRYIETPGIALGRRFCARIAGGRFDAQPSPALP